MAEVYTKIAEKIMFHISESAYAEGIDSVDFKAVVADVDGVALPIVTKSGEYYEGAISNELEWAKSYILQLREEMSIFKATGDRLNYFGEIYGYPRQSNEDDVSYRTRIIGRLRATKITKWAIIQAIQPYFLAPIRVVEPRDAAFFGVSFFNYYGEIYPPSTVKPALFKGNTEARFYFEIWIPNSALPSINPSIFGFFGQTVYRAFFNNQFFARKGQTGLNWLFIRELVDNTKIAGVTYNIFIVEG